MFIEIDSVDISFSVIRSIQHYIRDSRRLEDGPIDDRDPISALLPGGDVTVVPI